MRVIILLLWLSLTHLASATPATWEYSEQTTPLGAPWSITLVLPGALEDPTVLTSGLEKAIQKNDWELLAIQPLPPRLDQAGTLNSRLKLIVTCFRSGEQVLKAFSLEEANLEVPPLKHTWSSAPSYQADAQNSLFGARRPKLNYTAPFWLLIILSILSFSLKRYLDKQLPKLQLNSKEATPWEQLEQQWMTARQEALDHPQEPQWAFTASDALRHYLGQAQEEDLMHRTTHELEPLLRDRYPEQYQPLKKILRYWDSVKFTGKPTAPDEATTSLNQSLSLLEAMTPSQPENSDEEGSPS